MKLKWLCLSLMPSSSSLFNVHRPCQHVQTQSRTFANSREFLLATLQEMGFIFFSGASFFTFISQLIIYLEQCSHQFGRYPTGFDSFASYNPGSVRRTCRSHIKNHLHVYGNRGQVRILCNALYQHTNKRRERQQQQPYVPGFGVDAKPRYAPPFPFSRCPTDNFSNFQVRVHHQVPFAGTYHSSPN